MRLTGVIQRVIRLVHATNETSPTSSARAGEHRDQSSMADFVRILQDQDGKKNN
jgi:hypothetical protein